MANKLTQEARAALAATRELYAELGKVEREPDEYRHLRRLVVRANKSIAAMHRLAREERLRAAAPEAVLREAIAAEGVDRQANAARLQDRLRAAIERLNDANASPLVRARSAVATDRKSVV